jgi:hypothetical protein
MAENGINNTAQGTPVPGSGMVCDRAVQRYAFNNAILTINSNAC